MKKLQRWVRIHFFIAAYVAFSQTGCHYKEVLGTSGVYLDTLYTDHGIMNAEFEVVKCDQGIFYYPLLIYRNDSGFSNLLSPPKSEQLNNGTLAATVSLFGRDFKATSDQGIVVLIDRNSKQFQVLVNESWGSEVWKRLYGAEIPIEKKRVRATGFLNQIFDRNEKAAREFLGDLED